MSRDIKYPVFPDSYVKRCNELQNRWNFINNVLGGPQRIKRIIDVQEFVARAYENLRRRDREYPALINISPELAKRGWLISYLLNDKEFDNLAALAKENLLDELCSLLYDLYKGDIAQQMEEIIDIYPDRRFILEPSYRAHMRKEYSLSILAFFSEADGICRRNTGKELFTFKDNIWKYAGLEFDRMKNELKKNIQEYKEFFDKKYSYIALAMLAQLKEKLPMAYGKNERKDKEYKDLNRNVFLHSLAKESDATEENSLKAFSLLSFVASFLKKNDAEEPV